jgi:hypothetical protein
VTTIRTASAAGRGTARASPRLRADNAEVVGLLGSVAADGDQMARSFVAAQGYNVGFGGLELPPRDPGKFGHLYLNGGCCNGPRRSRQA